MNDLSTLFLYIFCNPRSISININDNLAIGESSR